MISAHIKIFALEIGVLTLWYYVRVLTIQSSHDLVEFFSPFRFFFSNVGSKYSSSLNADSCLLIKLT